MRSNTLIPLQQFTDWLGIPHFKAASVDYDSVTITPPTRSNYDTRWCIYQSPWVDQNNWSRDDIINMLSFAERMFVLFGKFYPAPFQVVDEIQQYEKAKNIRTGRYKLPSFKPDYGVCSNVIFARYAFTKHETVIFNHQDAGEVLDTFSYTFPLPSGYEISQIRVFEKDAQVLEYNDKSYEIRPLKITQSGPDVTIEGPASLFVKRELFDTEKCLAHKITTYEPEVDIYFVYEDKTEQAVFITTTEEEYPVSVVRKYIGSNSVYGQPINFTDPKCVAGTIQAIKYQYVTGYDLIPGGRVPQEIADIVFMLAIALADCIKKWSECEICAQNKINYYREVPKTLTSSNFPMSSRNDQGWEVLLTNKIVEMYPGFVPSVGFLQAIRQIRLLSCNVVEGGVL